MHGLLRPCRHELGPALKERWRAHLCGLCLTLRDESGQAARLLTGYDVLLLSVLVEAQAGPQSTTRAGACPLRGMRPATVLAASSPAARLAAAGGLLAGSGSLSDKVVDGDLPAIAAPAGRAAARRLRRDGTRLAEELGVDAAPVLAAAQDAARAETDSRASLDDLLAPAGRAVGALFAATAEVSGCPGNTEALRRAGDAFGRLVHLADARADLLDDERAGRFNPLLATAVDAHAARDRAEQLQEAVTAAMSEVTVVDGALLEVLLGPTLKSAVRREFPVPGPGAVATSAALGLAALATVGATSGVFGGGRRRGGYGPQWGPGYQQGPGWGYQQPYGYRRRRGPSCCDLLACDCCANMACNDCCGGDGCCVCI